MNFSRKFVGILAPVGHVRREDLDAFLKARLGLVKLRARVNPSDDVLQWRNAGASNFVLQLLSPLPSQTAVTPQMFVDYFSPEITAFMTQGVNVIEVLDEPNRFDRGAGVSWVDGDSFSLWFFETHRLFCSRFGSDARIGFPALAQSGLPRAESVRSLDEISFLEQCTDAMADADWVAIHTYWRTLNEMRGYDGALRFLRLYMEQLPRQTFMVTEFANVDPTLPSEVRGAHYVEFYTAMAQYDRLVGACSMPLRSSNPLYAPFAWLHTGAQPNSVLSQMAERPMLPDSQSIRMIWPTAFHQYHQYFGAKQKAYFDSYGLAGGHNGVDLRVDRSSPQTSPIVAALGGTVIQVALDETGYGHHVRIRSYGPDGSEMILLYAHLSTIDVTAGMLIRQGDIVGWAGATGDCDSPHLHLGMQVPGVDNGSVNNWLNPRPYLSAIPL